MEGSGNVHWKPRHRGGKSEIPKRTCGQASSWSPIQVPAPLPVDCKTIPRIGLLPGAAGRVRRPSRGAVLVPSAISNGDEVEEFLKFSAMSVQFALRVQPWTSSTRAPLEFHQMLTEQLSGAGQPCQTAVSHPRSGRNCICLI